MKAQIIMHSPIENAGEIESWLLEQDFEVSYTDCYLNENLDFPENIDWLIVMGGPMSVHDEESHPWLKPEKEYIKKCIENKKIVLGVCLGAQIIAETQGAFVQAAAQSEMGWYPLQAAKTKYAEMFEQLMCFHWHNENFDLPKNAELLASTVNCPNQIFHIGNNVWGFQCHLELNPENIATLTNTFAESLATGQTSLQNADEILAKSREFAPAMNGVLYDILDMIYYQEL